MNSSNIKGLSVALSLPRIGFLKALASLLLGLTTVSTANAALLFSNYSGEGPLSLSDVTVGKEFTVGSAPVLVSQLGVYDWLGDGLAEMHNVGIWRTSDEVLVASGMVSSGTAASLVQDWRFVDIAPVQLSANTAYRIGAYFQTNADFTPTAGTFNFDSSIASVDAGNIQSFIAFNNFAFPDLSGSSVNPRVAANATITAIPLPAALPLLLTGLLSVSLFKRLTAGMSPA